jgi:hypothetical protein
MMCAMVPKSLRVWFVIHFFADLAFAIPLFLAPTWTLELLGWEAVDPVATRLVAAALFGIGIESLLGRNADRGSFLTMLNLKVIWSATASLGILWSVLDGGPTMAWGLFAVFAGFHVVWLRYRIVLGRTPAQADA